jgi:hypothetical protein
MLYIKGLKKVLKIKGISKNAYMKIILYFLKKIAVYLKCMGIS